MCTVAVCTCEQLFGHGFVEGLHEKTIELLLDSMVLKTFKLNELIINEGRLDDTLYLIKRGKAICKKPQAVGKGNQAEKGMTTVTVETLHHGDLFGEQVTSALRRLTPFSTPWQTGLRTHTSSWKKVCNLAPDAR